MGGNNGVSMIVAALERRGWRRVDDPHATLRWAEVRRDLDFAAFRPGKQLLCRNPGASALGSKLKLLENLRRYCTARKIPLHRFFPETYKLDDAQERRLFFELALGAANASRSSAAAPVARVPVSNTKRGPAASAADEAAEPAAGEAAEDAARPAVDPNNCWICKPTGLNQGKGIFLVTDVAAFKKELSQPDMASKEAQANSKRWVLHAPC